MPAASNTFAPCVGTNNQRNREEPARDRRTLSRRSVCGSTNGLFLAGGEMKKSKVQASPLTDAERRLLAQVPPQPSTAPHVVRLLVTFDGAASRVEVARIPAEWPFQVLDAYALNLEILASGRSWGDVEQTLEAACLDSQGRTPKNREANLELAASWRAEADAIDDGTNGVTACSQRARILREHAAEFGDSQGRTP